MHYSFSSCSSLPFIVYFFGAFAALFIALVLIILIVGIIGMCMVGIIGGGIVLCQLCVTGCKRCITRCKLCLSGQIHYYSVLHHIHQQCRTLRLVWNPEQQRLRCRNHNH